MAVALPLVAVAVGWSMAPPANAAFVVDGRSDVGVQQPTVSTTKRSQPLREAAVAPERKNCDVLGGVVVMHSDDPAVVNRKVSTERFACEKRLLSARASSCDAVPAFARGEAIGIKVFGVAPNGFKSALGLRSGDVITAINGRTLDSPENALAAYEGLGRVGSVVVLDARRNDAPITLNYHFFADADATGAREATHQVLNPAFRGQRN